MKKRKDGRYCSRVTLPNGEKIDVYGHTQAEVFGQIDNIKLLNSMGVSSVNNKITLDEWAQKWWASSKSRKNKNKKTKIGEKCRKDYLRALNSYIIPHMGHIKLLDIRPIHCQDLLNSMSDKSESQQRQVLVVLNSIFKYACINGLIPGNPNQYTELTAEEPKKRNALSPDQVKIILERAKGTRAELLVHLALFCGLRRGELVGLMWNDIEGNRLHVNRAVEFPHNQAKDKSTKSKAGIRTLPIPPHLQKMLASAPKNSLYVLPSVRSKGQLSEQGIRRLWELVTKSNSVYLKNRLTFECSLHMLRHTYSTNLNKLGVDPKMHQYLMGHADLRTTLNIYTHIQEEQMQKADKMLTNILSISQKSVKTS